MSRHAIEWRCPSCGRPVGQDLDAEAPRLRCPHCAHRERVVDGGLDDGRLADPLPVCLACGSRRLYVQKDFNRKLGLAIVGVGAVASPWTYGLSLVACMLVDYGLYHLVPEITVCYGCDAIHRGFEHNPLHRAHDPLLAERYRDEARSEALGADREAGPPS